MAFSVCGQIHDRHIDLMAHFGCGALESRAFEDREFLRVGREAREAREAKSRFEKFRHRFAEEGVSCAVEVAVIHILQLSKAGSHR
ncbi:MAG: hypothetical protein P8L85_11140, partial [Rubripirellula sp.]|nr:hypothetical protein [Rubripirellula sp.]